MKKLLTFLTKAPVHKFYSDWTPLEKAYWGLWKAPSEHYSMQNVLDLNKDFLVKFKESNITNK